MLTLALFVYLFVGLLVSRWLCGTWLLTRRLYALSFGERATSVLLWPIFAIIVGLAVLVLRDGSHDDRL